MSSRQNGIFLGARITAALTVLLILCTTSIAGAAPASAAVGLSSTHQAVASDDLDNFAVESFSGEYRLDRDEAGRSTLTTTERIEAIFPDYDQNRGLIRDLVRVHDGRETALQILSVTDGNGRDRPYSTEQSGDFLSVIMAVPEGEYVHGAQTYIIDYTQRDVTRFFEDTGRDELYWDINGTGWAQPIGRVSARVLLTAELIVAFTGEVSCYSGAFGEQLPCDLTTDDVSVMAQTTGLAPGENMTLALGFAPGTFTAAPTPEAPFLQRVPLLIWAGIASCVAGTATFIVALVRGRRVRTGRAIIAQYEPPEHMSAALCAYMLRKNAKAMTATLLDLAVRRKIRLLRDDPSDQYGAQALDRTGLLPLEDHTYQRIFTGRGGTSGVAPGASYWFSKTSTRLGDASKLLITETAAEAKRSGLIKRVNATAIIAVVMLMLLALGLPVLHAVILGQFTLMTVLLAVGVNILVWLLVFMVGALSIRKRASYEGSLLLDHLEGLREFIRLAEADRIRMLQSASGAEVNEQRIVQVYERLLPYAVLFGFETEWQGELAKYYRELTPDWVSGTGANSGSFSHTLPLTSFAGTVMSSRVTPSASSGGSGSGSSFSSSSGGSSGGGFSGGGGGGGGGRGI